MASVLIVIPARMQATRLPGKPLADIHGEPMIVHVWRRAMEAEIGRVVVATDARIVACDRRGRWRGGDDAGRPSVGLRPRVRGGRPGRPPRAISRSSSTCRATCRRSSRASCGLPRAALARSAPTSPRSACEITAEDERTNPNVVKVVGTPHRGPRRLRALYFTRATAPYGEGPLFHHIGMYAYRRRALERFVSLPPSALEKREKLEQLRALEHGMRIEVSLVDTVPLGVDTPADLERAPLSLRAG